jgi:hypothetical protein
VPQNSGACFEGFVAFDAAIRVSFAILLICRSYPLGVVVKSLPQTAFVGSPAVGG